MKVPIWYMAHPVGAATQLGVIENVKNALDWLSWLIAHEPDAGFAAPWIPYVNVLDDSDLAARTRGKRDSVASAELHGRVVLCGGKISEGMREELDAVLGVPGRPPLGEIKVCDLTSLGYSPPAWPIPPHRATMLDDDGRRIESPIAWGQAAWRLACSKVSP